MTRELRGHETVPSATIPPRPDKAPAPPPVASAITAANDTPNLAANLRESLRQHRPATWDGPPGQPCDCPNLAGDCDGKHAPDLPAAAITAALRRAISDPGSITPRGNAGRESLTAWQTRAVEMTPAPALRAQGAATEREAITKRIRVAAIMLRGTKGAAGKQAATALSRIADLLDGEDG